MPLPVAAALGAAGISSAGSIASGIGGGLISANQAGIDRDDRRYYAEHAHQVEVADLKAAGLNPILSATGGSGAHFQGASGNDAGSVAASGMASGAQALAQIPLMLADLEIKQQQVSNLEKEGIGKDIQNSLSAGAVDKLNIDKKYWDGSAMAEYMQKLRNVDLSKAQAEAASGSARHYDSLIRQIGQSMEFERQGGGYKTGIAHDVKSWATKVENAVKEWLSNPGRAPVGSSNAKGR